MIAGLVFLFFLLVLGHRLHIPGWLQVVGRIHPLFVHFPIVLVLMVLLLYWLPQGQGVILDAWGAGVLRLVTALSAVFAAIMGMLLSLEGGREGSMLAWHQWAGVAVAVLASVYYYYYPVLQAHVRAGRSFTAGAALCIFFTGHWGGDLTHGENYVLGPVLKNTRDHVAPEKAVVFENIIEPILRAKCLQCHNASSSKGGLMMDKMSGLLSGGKSGPLFVSGKPDLSLIIQRIHLSEEEKKHMPPASKPQLTVEEAQLLSSWIQSGAPMEKKLFSLPARDSFRLLAQQWLSSADQEEEEPVYDFHAADEKKIVSLNNNYRVIEPLGQHSPALSVHFYGRGAYSAKAVEELLPLKEQIVDLSLARMPVKDNDLAPIGKMTNLRKLNLNYTDISAAGLTMVAGCKQLQELSLSGTAINAAALEKLLSLPQLSQLYIWDTRIDTAAIRTLRKKFDRVRIDDGFVDDGSFLVALSSPLIDVPDSLFYPRMTLRVHHPYKGVQIKYTMDGSLPDSSHGEVYTGPIELDSTALLVTRAFKKGWLGSPSSSANYIKDLRPDSAAVISTPDSLYKKIKPAILYDGDLGMGGLNSDDGRWLGYRGKDASYYLFYKRDTLLRSVTVYDLQQTEFENFPPVKIEVWGGKDKARMRLLGSVMPASAKKEDLPQVLHQKINFPVTNVRCLKVVAYSLRRMPDWVKNKNKPARLFISEILLN